MDSAPETSQAHGPDLLLFTRHGCCLCEGLEEKLHELGLSRTGPKPALRLVDIDADPILQTRYGLEVPVLAIRNGETVRELPRVPPRLMGERLAAWLRNEGVTIGSQTSG